MSARGSSPIWALVLLSACARELVPATPCTRVQVDWGLLYYERPALDLLFMIDNSSSMLEEQASLTAELPRMIYILTSGDFDEDGDVLGDGELGDVDFEPVSLQVGVVTSDMGTGGFPTPTCDEPIFGDDGVLRDQGNGGPGCLATYPPFMRFDPFVPGDPGAVACVAAAGTGGCGYEQPLEAVLKALSPSAPTTWTGPDYVAPLFFRNTYGHADTVNDGFVRPQSVLAIVLLTDEDDCSARDPELFDETGPHGSTAPGLRCSQVPAALHEVRRYVDGLLQLRRGPTRLLFAPIVGIPADLAPAPGESPAWDALLCDDPDACDDRMREEIDPAQPSRLRPSCDVPGRGAAYPPARILRVARDLEARGASVVVRSICQDSFLDALTEIIGWAGAPFGGTCLPRRIMRAADGRVPCEVRGLLPEGIECADVPGASPLLADGVAVHEGDRAWCVFAQVVSIDRSPGAVGPTEPGWFYDDFTGRGQAGCDEYGEGWQRIASTAEQPWGTQLRLTCLLPVTTETSDWTGIGAFCDPDGYENCEFGRSPTGAALACDALTHTCGVACTRDSDCRDGGLGGFVCDRRPLFEVDPRFEGVAELRDLCVNPTCG